MNLLLPLFELIILLLSLHERCHVIEINIVRVYIPPARLARTPCCKSNDYRPNSGTGPSFGVMRSNDFNTVACRPVTGYRPRNKQRNNIRCQATDS
jgi:hypothetical protein